VRTVTSWIAPGLIWLLAVVLALGVWVARDDAAAVAAIVTAVLALAVCGWVVRGDRPKGRRRCPKCWYDMTGTAATCPECGRTQKHEQRFFRTRRRWRTAVACFLVTLAGAGTAAWRAEPKWWEHTPTIVLYGVYRFTDWRVRDVRSELFSRWDVAFDSWTREVLVWDATRRLADAAVPQERADAARLLGMCYAFESVDPLIDALDDESPLVQQSTIASLGTMRIRNERFLESAHTFACESDDVLVRMVAYLSLQLLEPSDPRVADAFGQGFQDDKPVSRGVAINTAGNLDPPPPGLLVVLTEMMRDDTLDIAARSRAAVIASRCENADFFTADLIARLMKQGAIYPDDGVEALGHIGPEATAAIPMLERLVPLANVRSALMVIRGEAPTLADGYATLFSRDDPELRRSALEHARPQHGFDHEHVRSALLNALRDEDDRTRTAAWRAVRRFGEILADDLPVLRDLSRAETGDPRYVCKTAVRAIERRIAVERRRARYFPEAD